MKTCKEWVREQLNTKLSGEEFEVRLPNGRRVDWLFKNGDNCIVIEDKEKTDVNFEKGIIQLEEYYKELVKDYKNVISIIVKELKTDEHKVAAYKNGLLIENHPKNKLNSIDYYFSLFEQKFDKKILIKSIRELNQELKNFKIPDNKRASLASTFLICINKKMELSDSDSIKIIKEKVHESLMKYSSDDLNTWDKIKNLNERFKHDLQSEEPLLTSKILFEIWKFIKFKIFDLLNNSTTDGYDIMSLFFSTFSRYALSNDKGQYFTPDHISDIMTDLLNLNINSIVLDPTCGSGTFLTKSMNKMINLAKQNEKAILNIKQNQLFGIEDDPLVVGLAMANMLLHEDGKSNIECGDSFVFLPKLKSKKINRLIMNPPYGQSKNKLDKNDEIIKKGGKPVRESVSELKFLYHSLEILENQAIAVIILPTSCALGTKWKEERYSLMQKHTLKASFTCPTELFYPTAVNTCIMVWEAHVPHNGKTFLADWKNDGFQKSRLGKGNTVRLDLKNNWNSIKEEWLKNYNNKENGINIKLGEEDSWLFESHKHIDYSNLIEEDFVKNIRKYIAYKVKNGTEDLK